MTREVSKNKMSGECDNSHSKADVSSAPTGCWLMPLQILLPHLLALHQHLLSVNHLG